MATDPDLTQPKDSVYKVVLLGDSGVGKTSLFYRIKDGYFRETSSTTSQIATFEKPFRMPNGELMIQFVDTCGFETYNSSIPPSLLRNASVVLFVYAVDDTSSFVHLKHWYGETFEVIPEFLANKITKFMVGNKSDLPTKVSKSQVLTNCTDVYNIPEHNIIEVSAKDGDNIDLLCQKISESLCPKKIEKKTTKKVEHRDGGVKICKFF